MNAKKIAVLLFFVTPPILGMFLHQYINDGRESQESPVLTVAMVAGREITVDEFKNKMIRRSGGFSGQFDTVEQKQLLLDEMINFELQVVRAREAGYADDPEIVARMERIMVSKLREDELEQQLATTRVSEAEIENHYQQHLANYTTPAMSRIALIQIKVPQRAIEQKRIEQRLKAEKILTLAMQLPESTRGFGALAAKHSDHQPSRYIGGDVGWYTAQKGGRFQDPQIIQAVAALNDLEELSPIITTDDAYYLLKLLDVQTEQTKPITRVKSRIEHILLAQKRQAMEASWLAGLQNEGAPVKINLSVLESTQLPNQATVRKQAGKPANMPNG